VAQRGSRGNLDDGTPGHGHYDIIAANTRNNPRFRQNDPNIAAFDGGWQGALGLPGGPAARGPERRIHTIFPANTETSAYYTAQERTLTSANGPRYRSHASWLGRCSSWPGVIERGVLTIRGADGRGEGRIHAGLNPSGHRGHRLGAGGRLPRGEGPGETEGLGHGFSTTTDYGGFALLPGI